jgi:hypothetical protein
MDIAEIDLDQLATVLVRLGAIASIALGLWLARRDRARRAWPAL